MSYIIEFKGEFDDYNLKKFSEKLENIVKQEENPKGCEITIDIDSPGGYVYILFDVLEYIDFMKKKGFKFITYNRALAASCASVLFSVGHTRITHPTAKLLIHQISFGTSGEISKIEEDVEEAKEVNNRLFRILSRNFNYNKKKMMNKCYGKDWILSASEAKKLKFTTVIDIL